MSGFDVIGSDDLLRARLIGDQGAVGDRRPLAAGADGEAGDDKFLGILGDALREVSELGGEAKQKAEALARGEPVEVHDLFVAMGKSEVAFNLMLEVRNKMIEAWQQLSRAVI